MSNDGSFLADRLPEPPYYASILSFKRTAGDLGYRKMAERMTELVRQQPGFLGVERVREADGRGITVAYWRDAESIAAWKAQAEHQAAQALGKSRWYEHYEVRIAKVERAYAGP